MARKRTVLTQIGNEKYNVPAILHMIDAEARGAYGGSERTMIQLVASLIRAQHAEIERLRTAPTVEGGTT